MKKLWCLFMALFVAGITYCQLIEKAEVYNSGFNFNTYTFVAHDKTGSIYTLTRYTQTYTIGGDEIQLIAGGNEDMAITKYDPEGNYLWTRRFGANPPNGTYSEQVWGFGIDEKNEIMFVMSPPFNMANTYFDDTTLAASSFSSGNRVIKMDTDGNFVSAEAVPGLTSVMCRQGTAIYYCEGGQPGRVRKIDADGNVTTILTISSVDFLPIDGIFPAANGDLIVHGKFSGFVTAGSITIHEYFSNSQFGYVFRIDKSGNVKWGQRYQIEGATRAPKFISDKADNTYMVFSGPSSILAIWLFGINNYPLRGTDRVFILKIDNKGQVIREQQIYSKDRAIYGLDFHCDVDNNIYLLGRCGYGGIFPIAPHITDDQAYFVAKMDADGNPVWTVPFGGGGNMQYASFTTTNDNTFYISSIGGRKFQCISPDIQGETLNTFCVLKDTVAPTPKADFGFISNGALSSFHDSSRNATALSWAFGDGATSQNTEPVHIYQQHGIYNVCLTATNSCGADQKCTTVAYKGLRAIETNHAGNVGYTTCTVYGGGFTSETTVKLKSDGKPDIIPDTTVFINAGELIVRFKLDKQPIGLRDVEVTVPGDTAFSLKNGFSIENLIPFTSQVEIFGGGIHRTGRIIKFEVKITNKGNTDAYLAPLLISGIPLGDYNVQVYRKFKEFNFLGDEKLNFLWKEAADSGLNVSYILENYNTLYNDSIFFDKTFNILVPLIKANSSISFSFFIRSFVDFVDNLYASVSQPILINNQSLNFKKSELDACTNTTLDIWLTVTSNIITSYDGWFAKPNRNVALNCVVNAFNAGWAIGSFINGIVFEDDYLTFGTALATGVSIFSAILSCHPATALLASQFNIGNLFGKTTSLAGAVEKVSKGLDVASVGANLLTGLPICIDNIQYANQGYGYSGAIDPNFKTGAQGYHGSLHTNNSSALNYQIHFENLDIAALPAQKVIIIDTLDLTKVDISTFKWGSFSIGDTIIGVNNLDKNFVQIVDLSSKIPYKVKAEGVLDTVTGIVKWVFTTLHPNTLEPDTSFHAGFLPPNKNDPEGTGYVNFSVNMKSTVKTGDVINNTAHIYFDENAPIATNQWKNIVDITKPQSRVQPLPPVTGSTAIQLQFSGSDIVSGIHHYQLFVSKDDSTFVLATVTDSTGFTLEGRPGSKYEFYSIAIDSAGNEEDPPADADKNPDAVTIIAKTLPVAIEYFNAQKWQNTKSKLAWKAAVDHQYAYTIIERSKNNVAFDSAGTVVQNSRNEEIQWMDEQPHKGANYYRLKFVDRDGRYTYSPVRLVSFENLPLLTVTPNPARETLQVQLSQAHGKLKLTDAAGRMLQQIPVTGTKQAIDVKHYTPGVYILMYDSEEGKRSTVRVVIQ